MILDEIKQANIQALKDKNLIARTIYGIVLNKSMLEAIKKREKGEFLNDADLVQIIQKTLKELTEEAENYEKVGNILERDNILKQKEILKQYLPKMMTEDEIKKVILSLDNISMGNVMKHFKAEYAGKCDMKLVSDIAKKLL